jgi:hypothetical protein
MTRTALAFAAFALGALAVACNGDEKPDIRVVVIETNVPDEVAPPCPHRYEAESSTRTCGDAVGPPHICSSIELCEAQQAWIFEAFASCAVEEGSIDAEDLPDCP